MWIKYIIPFLRQPVNANSKLKKTFYPSANICFFSFFHSQKLIRIHAYRSQVGVSNKVT